MFLGEVRPMRRACSAALAGPNRLELGYGRFLQADPLGYEDGMNMYAYTGGDPINATDPTGTVTDAWYKLEQKIDGTGPTYLAAINREAAAEHAAQVAQINSADANGDGYIDQTESGALDPGLQKLAQSLPSYHPFSMPTYTDFGSQDIVVTGTRMISDSTKWVLVGNRYHENPNYVRPWYDIGLDGVLKVQTAAFVAAGAIVAAPVLSEVMAISRTFGVTSSRFGNSFYRGSQGSWNYGSTRLGWSYYGKTGNVYFQSRIGGFHVPTPIFTPAPW